MKLEINLKKSTIKALLRFAAVNDIRYYLNGIALETGPKGARLIATDGHRMAVARVDGVFPSTGEESIIIPRAMLEKIKTTKRLSPVVTLSISGEAAPYLIRLDVDGEIREIRAIDGKFPDWQRCFPMEFSGQPANLNPLYIGEAGAAALDLGDTNPLIVINYNGTGAALIEYPNYPDFTAIIMPMRAVEPTHKSPAWLKNDLDYRYIPHVPEDEAEMRRYQDQLARMAMDDNARRIAQAVNDGGLETLAA